MCAALITNFIISLISGIIAGLILICWQKWDQKEKLKGVCEPLVGKYKVLTISDERIVIGAQIKISYKSYNALETVGISQDSGEWSGRLIIDERSPNWASGYFKYYKLGLQGNENGLHKVIIDRENKRLYVNIETFTHEGQKTKALIWQKCN